MLKKEPDKPATSCYSVCIVKKRDEIQVIDFISSLEDLVRELEESGMSLLFRGTSQEFSTEIRTDKFTGKEIEDGINTFIHRKFRCKVDFSKGIGSPHIEEEILRGQFSTIHPDHPPSREGMLTDLAHQYNKANVVDFTCKLLIALFFTCYKDEDLQKDGEIIILDRLQVKDKILETLSHRDAPFIVEAVETGLSHELVNFQGSVLVYPPAGYIDKSLCHKIIQVPAEIKKPMLDYLREKHDIHCDKVFKGRSDKCNPDDLDHETPLVKCYYGLELCNKGLYKESIVEFDGAINSNNIFTLAEAYNGRGVAKYHLGREEEAIDDYNKAIELKHEFVDPYNNRGLVKHRLGQNQEAISDFDKAIDLNPKHAKAHNNRGRVKVILGQSHEALADYNKAINLNPKYASPYHNRGRVKLDFGQPHDAIDDFNKAIALNEKLVDAFIGRGDAYHLLGKKISSRHFEYYGRCMHDYRHATKLNPNYAMPYNQWGRVQLELALPEEAVENFNRVIEILPRSANGYYNRGLAYTVLGEQKKARSDFLDAKKLAEEASNEELVKLADDRLNGKKLDNRSDK